MSLSPQDISHGLQIVAVRWHADSATLQRLNPVKNCSDIPWVLSSKYEGDFMEPAMRHNSALTYYDFRARMWVFSSSNIVHNPILILLS